MRTDYLLNDEEIKEIEKKIGYTFKNKLYLSIAFRRKSLTEELRKGIIRKANNESLEFYGDSVLNYIVIYKISKGETEVLKNDIPAAHNEEQCSNFISALTDKDNLSRIIGELDIAKYLLVSKGDIEKEVDKSPSVKEDLFEALVGAIWFDNDRDFEPVLKVVDKLLDINPEQDDFLFIKNDYMKLKEFIDRNPSFKMVEEIKNNIRCISLYQNDELFYEYKFIKNITRHENRVDAAYEMIEKLKVKKLWDVPNLVETVGITPENAINKLQELYQKKIIYLNPVYSNGTFNREDNEWVVECTMPHEDLPYTIEGTGRTKAEAKKEAAYLMYMDIAKQLND